MPTLEQKLQGLKDAIPSEKPFVSIGDKCFTERGLAEALAQTGGITSDPAFLTAILDMGCDLRDKVTTGRVSLYLANSRLGPRLIDDFISFTESVRLGTRLFNDRISEEVQIAKPFELLNAPAEPESAYVYHNNSHGCLTVRLTYQVPKLGIYPTALILESYLIKQLSRQTNLSDEANLAPNFTRHPRGRPPKNPLLNP